MLKAKFRRNDVDMSDTDISEGVAKEAELVRLQRQYRLMEGDRKSYCDSSKSLLAKQRINYKTFKKKTQCSFQLTLVERRLDYQEKNGIRHEKQKKQLIKENNTRSRFKN
ncbi:hypothetical protein BCR32DRAFT_286092 [Anaeromyces robustus]|uniref:Uncharacterized protein n=1 Tax=Anaeromyces robustus TaxID=1754192 RepID=A0A1Y1W6T8_9FUNG|nr:hypothetical protein BCR32DRAFT_286092 [Anaeromyces robustus]|eukprot:ORX68884.1 hypothetical protein BCR32DRAFT_286092 [Anaeromyces robustus]